MMHPSYGIDSKTQAALWRAGLGGAAADLTPEEIDALREYYSSDDAASTVSGDLEEASSPYNIPATTTTDPIFGFHDPIVVSQMVPERQPLIPGPNERIPVYQVKFMPEEQVANLCFLLEDFSQMLTEKINIQELAKISGEDYISMYRIHLGDRMD